MYCKHHSSRHSRPNISSIPVLEAVQCACTPSLHSMGHKVRKTHAASLQRKKVLTSVNWCPLETHRLQKCALRLPQVSGERGTQCHRYTKKINHMGTSSGHCTLAAQGDESKMLVGPEALAPRSVTVSTDRISAVSRKSATQDDGRHDAWAQC